MFKILKVEINISRLEYLLNLYKLTEQEFLRLVSKGLKNELSRADIFSKQININHLKRVDKIFNKGLSFYLNPESPSTTKATSIFFRKSQFNTELNLKSKQIVNEFEELKLSLSALVKLSDIKQERILPILTLEDNAKDSALKFRKIIGYSFVSKQKDFLKSLINKLANHNILVFEFVETWNQIERANIDGIYLNPNVIVLKRLEGHSFKREIFTLIHEFGHYLLNIEEIEKIDYDVLAKTGTNDIEIWCNDFSFYFLLGEYYSLFENLPFADPSNDYNHDIIAKISANTHLSRLAMFTKLLFDKQIDYTSYSNIKIDLNQKAKEYYEEVKKKYELEKERFPDKQKGGAPQPIKSELFISTVQTAFYEGVIDEYQLCKTLKISHKKIANYI